jgi:hypothetical protein
MEASVVEGLSGGAGLLLVAAQVPAGDSARVDGAEGSDRSDRAGGQGGGTDRLARPVLPCAVWAWPISFWKSPAREASAAQGGVEWAGSAPPA